MIQRFLFGVLLTFSSCSYSQEVVEWAYVYNKKESTITMNAKIGDGWHMYSQHINDGIGPIPTSFTFDDSKAFKLIGNVSEPKPIVEYDENFEGELSFFEDEVTFTQKIKVKKSGDVNLTITFMVCNGEMCLPPKDRLFTISLEK